MSLSIWPALLPDFPDLADFLLLLQERFLCCCWFGVSPDLGLMVYEKIIFGRSMGSYFLFSSFEESNRFPAVYDKIFISSFRTSMLLGNYYFLRISWIFLLAVAGPKPIEPFPMRLLLDICLFIFLYFDYCGYGGLDRRPSCFCDLFMVIELWVPWSPLPLDWSRGPSDVYIIIFCFRYNWWEFKVLFGTFAKFSYFLFYFYDV